jgi:PPM family protein phosphatase
VRLGQVASVTDPGRRRRRNEDAFVVRPPLFAVADGMGGARAGEIASRLATEVLREGGAAGGGEERIDTLIQAANQRIFERSAADEAASGMGTTVTVALVEDGIVWIGHVGDSRAYLIRDGALRQLTDDHSVVGELLRSGKLSAEEAETHPQRSVITRALGTDPDVDADTFAVEAREDDLFLLCSDGLTTMVDDQDILRTVERHRGDLEQAARELVASANRGGGEDNVTIVFFEIVSGDEVESTAEFPAAVPEPAETDEDEDTLTELDAIPTIAGPAAEPERPTLRRRVVAAAIATVLLVLIAVVALALWQSFS